jgi:hypothetical protein
MARNCALNHLAKIKAALGDLDLVERIVKVTGYVNVAPGFRDMPKVIHGESDLLVQLWKNGGNMRVQQLVFPRLVQTLRSKRRRSY